MKGLRLKSAAVVIIGLASIVATRAPAQSDASRTPPQAALAPADTGPLAAQQVDQLVAPVALYDDPLLVDVLTASSYPVEIVEAQRWASNPANAALKSDSLATALTDQTWDPSVKALVPFPQVLNLMYSHLDWTEHLGDAFVANRAAVMDSIQRMRHRAQSAGTLNSSAQQIVGDDGGFVTITPPASEIYVPAYDPWCVYGSWQVSAPSYYAYWPGYCAADDDMLSFGVGFHRPFDYWEWGNFDWLRRDIRINHDRFTRYHSGHDPVDSVGRQDTNGGTIGAHHTSTLENAGSGSRARAQLARTLSSTGAISGGFDSRLGSRHFGGSGVVSQHLGSSGVGDARFGGAGLGARHFGGGGLGVGHFGGGGFGGGHIGGGGFGGGHGGGGGGHR
jgi:hypothetical protein